MDSGEKRLNELGYKQELRREMTLFKSLAITFSTVTMFAGIPLYGQSLLYAGPASLVWGWIIVSFFTCFVGLALAEICSSFPARLGKNYSVRSPDVELRPDDGYDTTEVQDHSRLYHSLRPDATLRPDSDSGWNNFSRLQQFI